MELSEKEIIVWAAAFFDAEGCIHLDKSGQIQIIVENLSYDALQMLYAVAGGSITKFFRNGKMYYRFRCCNSKAIQFLQKVLPYLIIKRDVAKYAIDYYNNGKKDKEKYRHLINSTLRGDY